MAIGVRVKVHRLFESVDDVEYTGVTTITFDAGFHTMTLVGSASGTSVSPASGAAIDITNALRVEILRSTTEFPGLGAMPSA